VKLAQKWIVGIAALAVWSGGIGRADAALITFTSAAAFTTANPGLAVEGFQNANTSNTTTFTGPVNNSTNNAVFSPGDILPGVSLTDSPGPDGDALYLAAAGQSANPTLALGSNLPITDAMDIFLNPGVSAVGFDIFQNGGGGSQSGVPQSYSVSVYGTAGLLGTFPTTVQSGQPGFFGVQSTADAITRVSLLSPTQFEVVDNVRFGGAAQTPIPEPMSMFLLGTGLVGGAVRRYRQRQS
jgi:hypothetical protein